MNMEFSDIKVTRVESMGNDLTVVNAARVSFGNLSPELTEKDSKLIEYLAKHEHLSPFEHCALTVLVECPLYIRSQIHRHRTFAYNEISRRYTADGLSFYIPPVEDIRIQSKDNKQASEGPLSEEISEQMRAIMENAAHHSAVAYDVLISHGVSREQARGILPQCLMTKFYMTGNLRNWAHFIRLRVDSHAQKEAQYVGKQAQAILTECFPVAAAALFKYSGSIG